MSSVWVPPQPTYHLRVFVLSLFLIVLCLLGLLFGVRLEDVVPATGTIASREQQEVRARLNGLVEPGWYTGQVTLADGSTLAVRLDADGNGLAEPGPRWAARAVRQGELTDKGQRCQVRGRTFHALQPGDLVWPGQVLGAVRDEALQLQYVRLEDQLKYQEEHGQPSATLTRERERLQEYLALGRLRVPDSAACWLVLTVPVTPLQKVGAGDLLATLVPVDPVTKQPSNLVAVLDVEEQHWGSVAAGQRVRLQSNVFNPRLHGFAEACLDRLAPVAEAALATERRFRAQGPITQAPMQLPLGSSFQAEIVVGRKLVYRLILEN